MLLFFSREIQQMITLRDAEAFNQRARSNSRACDG